MREKLVDIVRRMESRALGYKWEEVGQAGKERSCLMCLGRAHGKPFAHDADCPLKDLKELAGASTPTGSPKGA